MGCWTSFGRIVLIILNVIFFCVSLAVLVIGILLRFFPDKLAEWLLGGMAELDQATQDSFNIPDIASITEMPFIGEFGVIFIVFGTVLFFISFLAYCGACGRWRCLLVMFAVLMTILLLAQIVVGGLFLAKDSSLHEAIRNTLGDKVSNEFKADGSDAFSYSINLVNYLVECCGIRDGSDFGQHRPPSCCNRTIIDGDSSWDAAKLQCSADPPTAPDDYYNQLGCYQRLQDLVYKDLTLSVIVFTAILIVQLLEIVFACLLVSDINDRLVKIKPH